MAQRVRVDLVDDIDGSAAEESVEFALDGVSYVIDLSTENAAELRETLASGPSLRVVLAGAIRADVVPPLSEGPPPMTFAAGHASRVWRCPIAGASPMRFGRPTRRLTERSFTPIRAERVRVEDDVPRDGDVVAVFGRLLRGAPAKKIFPRTRCRV